MKSLEEKLMKKTLEQAKFEAKAEMEAAVRERDEKLMSVQVSTGT